MARNRRSSMLSFTGKNRKTSSGSIPKVDAAETAKEKAAFHINTKADPTKAINEAQPATRNTLEATTIESIRSLEHRDADGNVITDPDLSNPTRPRMERPLDTIRSFEAAIDGSYNRRASFRAESTNPMSLQNNRRSGFFSGYQAQQQRSPADGGGYYGNRMSHSRPDSIMDNYGNAPNQHGSGRRFGPRNHSDPALYGHNNTQGVYPSHGHQQSYDTVASASNGSHATDQWGNSTDPSSENSSIDRVQTAPKPDLGEAYGFNGFGGAPQIQGPILEEHGHGAPGYGHPGYGQSQVAAGNGHPYQGNGAPAPPPHAPPKDAGPRVPIKLGSSAVGMRSAVGSGPPPAVDTDKRKSWLKRRFSKG
ncbi:hypothetical protein HO133_004524 [Letharia lupina]|uniref:Uncharacterized protein n=1 Tax=Letharia lupina TaxID=560253 RepID=A0A8H6FKG7_9LECA|nr:uncharacterized protein HO133_004524 [Letharia lupina]KAF6230185.1 hypothetical protein HO133_004524 [Letharia lupina]